MARAFGTTGDAAFSPGGTQIAGGVVPLPPSSQTPLGRQQIRNEIVGGKAAYESTLPPPTKTITIDQIRNRIPANDD